ncbi:hypothetical protein LTR16_002240 [Cryomyces antarcticus]|uniref:Zinc finger Mcm10/DnaG-type domain-containing protein n=1 Tax=Cryomyces antarcticus TaxID=329879 RepID=A0ABR0LYT1_9PEZI|nr:hypothetical protein LTR16_002240 [Cryomyces antarcticus]
MIVRESASAIVSPSKSGESWPPKSPYQALLSSPSGRKKLERRRDRGSPSPSPLRKPLSSSKALQALSIPSDDDEEDDEETLQLQLQAIEAKLKLKKLRAAKAKRTADAEADVERGSTRSVRKGDGSRTEGAGTSNSLVPSPQLQVPLSPAKVIKADKPPRSPARVLLGIDKGLRAQDVSLKRARDGTRIGVSSREREKAASIPPPKSFSERIAESRLGDKDRQAKQERLKTSRSRTFGMGLGDDGGFKDVQRQSNSERSHTRTSEKGGIQSLASRPLVLHQDTSTSSTHPVKSSSSQHTAVPTNHFDEASNTDQPSEDNSIFESFSGFHLSKRNSALTHDRLARTFTDKEIYSIPRLLKEIKAPDYEPPDIEGDYVVLGVVASKSTPHNHKATNNSSTNGVQDEDGRSKYMVLKISDLKWEIDLFLFDTGFSQFWKITLGTVVAILNPSIMPPRPEKRDTGAFSLKLTSSDDTVLELGMSRDLGFCKAVKKDGQECRAWIDKRRTEVCEFHVYLQLERAKAGRMEVNTMVPFGGRGDGGRGTRSKGRGIFGGRGHGDGNDGLKHEGRYHDRATHETAYIVPAQFSRGRSTAALMDDDEADTGAMERGCSKAELTRRRLAERERERLLAEKLGASGRGMGSEYLRLKHAANRKTSAVDGAGAGGRGSGEAGLADGLDEPLDAAALGLLSNRAEDVSFSPVKKRRIGSARRAHGPTSTAGGSEAMGWGGAYKSGILYPKGPKEVVEKGQTTLKLEKSQTTLQSSLTTAIASNRGENGVESPVKKRARFVLGGKGIREPGRGSLGEGPDGLSALVAAGKGGDDESDDGLDVI